MNKTDQELITGYLSGDDDALSFLVHRHARSLYNFAFRIAQNEADAEDIAQEAFFKAWKNLEKFRTGENFTAWIFQIARNTAYDLLRKRRSVALSRFENSEGDNALLDTLQDEEETSFETLVRTENETLIQNALQKLPPLYREVLILRYYNEFTFDEIGRVLSKPLDTVKSQHRRALIILRRSINAPKHPL